MEAPKAPLPKTQKGNEDELLELTQNRNRRLGLHIENIVWHIATEWRPRRSGSRPGRVKSQRVQATLDWPTPGQPDMMARFRCPARAVWGKVRRDGRQVGMTPKDFFKLAEKHQAQMVDLKFVDMLGYWQHCSFPIDTWNEGTFEEGLGFDGSSIRGWKGIHESDMLAVPDTGTACVDPFFKEPTVSVIADVIDPVTRQDFTRDPRHVARKAEELSASRGSRTSATSDRSRSSSSSTRSATNRTSTRDITRSIRSKAHGTRHASRSRTWATSRASKEDIFPSALPTPTTTCAARWCTKCAKSASSSKHTTMRWQPPARAKSTCSTPLLKMADQFMCDSHLQERRAPAREERDVHAEADFRGQRQRHAHPRLSVEGNQPLFAGDRYAGLSELGLHAAGGLLKHAPALLAFAAPTSNSYRRLVPGFEAPVNLALSARNRSAAIRIRCTRRIRRQSGWSSAVRIRAATATWPGRRC